MANLLSAPFASNEGGSPAWGSSWGSPTRSNSTDYFVDGERSLKAVGTGGSFNVAMDYGDRHACAASTEYDFWYWHRSTASRWLSAAIDWYNSGGGYISTTVVDGSGNSATSDWVQRIQQVTSPSGAASFTPKWDYDANASGQTLYLDAIFFGIDEPEPSRRIFVVS